MRFQGNVTRLELYKLYDIDTGLEVKELKKKNEEIHPARICVRGRTGFILVTGP
jgi:hypothetical protein